MSDIGDEKYVMLTTFTKDGRAKPTPIWVAPFDGGVAVWTVADSWKVKRIRNTPRVTVQGSDARGTKLHGPVLEGTATILDAADTARVRDAIAAKYGIIGRLTLLGSRLRRGPAGTVGIAIVAG
ncbi:PPOX class F420-dependent oxidoreductase [Millisia brevis]|uniref:PPOX class F420-dependent oxidoreductase n=1 Tax=Millisia brevis TaxID=264148 RepID=UPI000A0048C9|nr:PPOX class F420-dependent oxidoreductase [Millisia brevis]